MQAHERKACLLWLWEDAPEEYKKLSTHGGDEDYVIFVPSSVQFYYEPPFWVERISVCGEPDKFKVQGGTVYITAHS